MTDNETPLRPTTIALMGGVRARGPVRIGARAALFTAVGGMDLDLTEAAIPPQGLTITKVSLVGGVSLLVRPDVRVEVRSISLFGGRDVERDAAAAGPVVRVRAYGLVGGVRVRVRR